MKIKKTEVIEFLTESNAIEGVFSDMSLDQAWIAWKYLMSEKKMTPDVVLKTHKLLMLHQNLYPNEKGYFRTVPVYIGGHSAINAILIPERIEAWCEDMNEPISVDFLDLDRMSRNMHVAYEGIHPFVDGNGRTGRHFMNWWRVKNGMPLLTIHEGEEQMKYYTWFR